MDFLSSLKGLIKHKPVVTDCPTKSSKSNIRQVNSNPLPDQKHEQISRPTINPQTKITTQRPAPSTPSPRAHA